MISLWDWLEVIKQIVDADVALQALGVKGAFYQVAPSGITTQFVVHQMQSGSFDRTLGGISGMEFSWQFCGVSGDHDGVSGLKRTNEIALRLFEMLDDQPDFLTPYLAPLGFECELVRATQVVVPRLQEIGGAMKWRYGHNYEFLLQPTG